MAATATATLLRFLPPAASLPKNPDLSSSSSFSSYSMSRGHGRRCFLLKAALSSPVSASAASAAELALAAGPFSSGDVPHSLDISKLGISEEIVTALSRRGITELFPIQRAVLEPAMEGRDMIGRAITGSGKTLAFGIPILDKIIRHQRPHRRKQVPSALVLAPTRELARQVQKEFKESAPNLSSACLYGGVPISNQSRALGLGIDIAVGTPGRIIDLVERGSLDLSQVKFLVLDEADQMLAIGFQEDVECILRYLPAKKQCMLFSATMPSWVSDLSRRYLKDPLVIDLVGDSDQKLADSISLYSVPSTASGKQTILQTLISKYGQSGKSIVFTKTKKDAEVLSRSMGTILGSRALHGNMQQPQRDRTLTAFRDGRFNVLVATDVAARGLDIPNVDLVVHFEMPNSSEIFVHRSGRTGRAGKKGTAVLMFTESQRRTVRSIERDLGCKFEELPRITGGVGSKFRTMNAEGSDTEMDNVDHFAARNYWPPRTGKYGNAKEARGSSHNSLKLKGKKTLTGRIPFHDYERESGSYFSNSGFKSGINTVGRNSRVGFSEYGLQNRSFISDTTVDDDKALRRKRKPINSESSEHDFKQIFDALW